MKVWIDPKLCHNFSGSWDCQDCFDQILRHRPCLTKYENDDSQTVTVFVKTESYQMFTIPSGIVQEEAGAAPVPGSA